VSGTDASPGVLQRGAVRAGRRVDVLRSPGRELAKRLLGAGARLCRVDDELLVRLGVRGERIPVERDLARRRDGCSAACRASSRPRGAGPPLAELRVPDRRSPTSSARRGSSGLRAASIRMYETTVRASRSHSGYSDRRRGSVNSKRTMLRSRSRSGTSPKSTINAVGKRVPGEDVVGRRPHPQTRPSHDQHWTVGWGTTRRAGRQAHAQLPELHPRAVIGSGSVCGVTRFVVRLRDAAPDCGRRGRSRRRTQARRADTRPVAGAVGAVRGGAPR
jgi:hypothetical protein